MIDWKEKALEDMDRIQEITNEKSGVDAAEDATIRITSAANMLDKKMSGSRPGRLGIGEREKLVDIENKKAEFIIFYDDDKRGNITILAVKHHLEKTP